MRESTNWSRSWRVRLNFLARLKNKINHKVDKFFVNHYFGPEPEQAAAAPAAPPPTHVAAQGQPGSTPHSQFEYNEASGSNHTSTQNSQYFDAVDIPEYLQQYQISGAWHGWSSQPDMVPASSGLDQDLGMHNTGQQLDQGDDMLIDHLPASHDQIFLPDFDHQYQQVLMSVNEYNIVIPGESELAGISEFSDAVPELQRDEPMSSWQANANYSQGYGAPSLSMQMSGDTVETVDSNTMDTGDSNFTYVLPSQPVQQRRTVIKGILTVQDVKHILFDEEDSRVPGRGFRVVASIVYAYRKLRALVRRKRMQRCTPSYMSGEGSGSCKLKRIKSADCSRVYLGIKQRRGKWVAEIRVSKMPDKVWLGSYPLEKLAALAYDAGLHHCSMKRTKVFNFKESPQRLGPSQYVNLLAMSKEDRKATVKTLACDYAMAYGSSNNIR